MNFEQAIEHILRFEGGLVENPKDTGGVTNFGISQRAYPSLKIRELTIEGAKEIYRRDYWEKVGIGRLPPFIRLLVFDCAVNQGPRSAILLLQEALGVPLDGVLGPKTEFAAKHASPGFLISQFAKNRSRRYRAVHGFQTFGLGWMNRLLDVTLETVATMGG